MKNVILIVVDTLRPDFLGFYGRKPNPSIEIDKLFTNGLTAQNMFSVGCPTTRSLPGLFTSTYPLDNGGYDDFNRQDTIAEVFKKHNYQTAFFWITTILFANESYGRGFDQIIKGGTLFSILKAWSDGLKFITPDYISKKRTLEECLPTLKTLYLDLMRAIKIFCDEKIKDSGKIKSTLIDDPLWNFAKIKNLANEEERKFLQDPKANISKWLERSIKEEEKMTFYKRLLSEAFHPRSNSNSVFDYIAERHTLVMKKFQKRAKIMEKLIPLGMDNFEQASAGYLTGRLLDWIDRVKDRPFFAYFHLHDVHPLCNFFSFDLVGADIKKEAEELMKVYNNFKDLTDIDGQSRLRYLLGIKYVDLQIKKIIAYLTNNKLIDNTLIIFTADHGTHYPGNPHREGAHVAESFYNEFFHTPIAFYGAGVKPQALTGLYSSIDIAPTILDITGLKKPKSFKGKSMKSFKGRDFVFMEKNGNGYCNLNIHPVTMAVINTQSKIVYENKPNRILELYDLKKDPQESFNLANDKKSQKKVLPHIKFAQKRLKNIYGQIRKDYQ